MPEPFMYGVMASILHKIENSDHFFISDDKKSNLKTDLIKLISDVKAQNYYPHEILGALKKVLYDLDDIIDAEMSENYVADIDKVLEKLRLEINGRSSFQTYWARFFMAWRSTGGKYLPEKLEWRDAGLAACFAYCALYPKGHVISRENLVNQWLANGFVLPSGDEDLEDAGNRYFNLLLSRGAFQDVRFAFGANRSNNQAAVATVVSCHMHPDAYDEACQIAGQDIQIISDQMSVCLNCKYAALDVINWENFEFEKFQKTTLRALLVFAANSKLLERLFHDTSPILENLCVLDLTGMHVVDVQWLRGCSRSLRYLSLSHNLNLLLLSIFRHCLQLQTLVLDRCSVLYRPHLFELGRLRHLYLTIREEYIPGLHQLTALRILELSGCAKLRLLSEGTTKYATTLRILRIFYCPRLVSLGTGKESLPSSIEEIIFHNCPSLFLSNGRAMNELPNLQRLELIGLDKLVELPVGLQTAIRLQYVMIANCIKLKSLIDVLGHLKSLEILCIYNCSKLLGLPEVVHSLSSLQSLHIRGCPNLYNQLEKCTKDRAFIAHIPDIDIQLPDIDIDLQDHDMESQSSILPYFTMKNIMSEKARYSYDPKKKPANKRSKWDNLALVLSAIKSMQASVRETYRIEGEKRKRERELFEKQEQLLEEPKLMCSLFPGGSEIERETLIQLWMAGGLLKNVYINFEGYLVDSSTEGDALEYYGSLYLQTLENTGFLLPSTLDKSKYRVNPDNNLHGKTQSANRYCQLKEENGAVCAPPPPPSSSSSVTPRHVSLTLTSDHVDEAALFKTLKEFEGLKTLLLMGSSSLKHVPSDFFTTLKVLCTLDLSGSQISEVPWSIGYLIHLHYFDLSYTLIERLPESTDCLQELQTLKLNGCKHLVELPPGLKNLIKLRHLYFDDLTKVARMPRGLSELTELQTLSAFIVDDSDNGCNIEELKSLNNLTGSLCVSGLENVPLDYGGQNILRHKMHVVQLQLTWKPTTDSDEEEFIEELKPNACLEELHISCYPCKKLPNWMADGNEFRKLARIQLLNCQNTEFNTPLGQLPGLQYLEIIQMNRVETLDECFRGDEDTDVAYSNLDTLIIEGMDSLLSWNEIQSQDFPKLSKLVIKQCPNLTKFPFLPHIVGSLKHLEINSTGIQELPLPQKLSLQTLKIINCPSLEEKCSTGGEYWDQIRDIPEILFSEDADISIARTFGDNKLADTIAFGSEAKPSKEMLPLVPGEKDLKLLTGDYELEKERLSPGSEDSTKDGSSADKIAWQTMDDYREEKERPVMDGQDVTRDESLANKTISSSEIEAREESVHLVAGEDEMERPADDYEQVNERFIASSEAEASISNIIGYDEMLLYILLFLNEYEFEKEKLIRLWVAAGFLKDEPMEDDGHRVFDSILAKNFIEKASENENDREMYKINSESLSSFIDEVEGSRHFTDKMKNLNVVVNRSNEDWDISIRHGEVKQENFDPGLEFSKLRSILFLKGLTFKSVPSNIYSTLKNLRMLDLSDCNDIKDLSSYVSNAIQLRYLGLSRTKIERLPDSITDLSELQTLELKGCSCLSHLPMRMNQLTKLRHLEFDIFGQLTSMPEGIGALVELRTLLAFIVGSEEGLNIKELKNMNHLSGKIYISGLENVTKLEDAKDAALIDKNRLLQLELRWSNNTCVEQRECDYDGVLEGLEPNTSIKELQIICFPGSAFPKWVGDDLYVNLDSITLYKCEDCKSLPALGGLPNLKKLEIKEMHGVKEIDDRIPYPALEKLTIDGMRSLKKWSLLNGDIFPSLDGLFIKHCPKLETLSRSNNLIWTIIGNMIPNNRLEWLGISCKFVEINECPKLKDLPDVLRLDSLKKLTIKDCPFGENYRAGCKGMKKIADNTKVTILP